MNIVRSEFRPEPFNMKKVGDGGGSEGSKKVVGRKGEGGWNEG